MNAPRPKLDIDRTRDRLIQLGCLHASDQLDSLLSEAVRKPVAAHDFLEALLEAEISGCETRRVKTSLHRQAAPQRLLHRARGAFLPRPEGRPDRLQTSPRAHPEICGKMTH